MPPPLIQAVIVLIIKNRQFGEEQMVAVAPESLPRHGLPNISHSLSLVLTSKASCSCLWVKIGFGCNPLLLCLDKGWRVRRTFLGSSSIRALRGDPGVQGCRALGNDPGAHGYKALRGDPGFRGMGL